MDDEDLKKRLHAGSAKHEVGYCKPPKETQFKPGQSGNPRGRPKGSKNKADAFSPLMESEMRRVIQQEALRKITIAEGNKSSRVTTFQGIVRSMAFRALKGDLRAQKMFWKLVEENELESAKIQGRLLTSLMQYKFSGEQELRERQALGMTDLPDLLPHPDHVIVDLVAGRAEIVGPTTIEEKEAWDKAAQFLSETLEEIDTLERAIGEEPDPRLRDLMQPDLDAFKMNLRKFRELIEPRRMRFLEIEAQRLWKKRRDQDTE